MTRGERDWICKVLPVWRLRAEDCLMRGETWRLLGLESVIRRLEVRLAAAEAEPAPAMPGEADELRARLARFQPQPHPVNPQVMMYDGPIFAGLRHDLALRIAALSGEAPPAAPVPSFRERMRDRDRVLGPPANDPAPFIAGAQVELFG